MKKSFVQASILQICISVIVVCCVFGCRTKSESVESRSTLSTSSLFRNSQGCIDIWQDDTIFSHAWLIHESADSSLPCPTSSGAPVVRHSHRHVQMHQTDAAVSVAQVNDTTKKSVVKSSGSADNGGKFNWAIIGLIFGFVIGMTFFGVLVVVARKLI